MGKTTFTKLLQNIIIVMILLSALPFLLLMSILVMLRFFHFDLYRISDEEDLYSIGFCDYIREEAIFVIEWSENIPSLSDEFSRVLLFLLRKLTKLHAKL